MSLPTCLHGGHASGLPGPGSSTLTFWSPTSMADRQPAGSRVLAKSHCHHHVSLTSTQHPSGPSAPPTIHQLQGQHWALGPRFLPRRCGWLASILAVSVRPLPSAPTLQDAGHRAALPSRCISLSSSPFLCPLLLPLSLPPPSPTPPFCPSPPPSSWGDSEEHLPQSSHSPGLFPKEGGFAASPPQVSNPDKFS